MTTPPGCPSVVKIKKGNVEYTGKVDIAKYTIKELTRRAMQDVGRYVLYNVRAQLKAGFAFTSKGGKKQHAPQRYQVWVPKRENYLIIGIENKKHGARTAWWADQLELDQFTPTHTGGQKPGKRTRTENGVKVPVTYRKRGEPYKRKTLGSPRFPRRHILETFVKGHVDKIVEIEKQYLSYMNDENAAMAAIAETAEKEINE